MELCPFWDYLNVMKTIGYLGILLNCILTPVRQDKVFQWYIRASRLLILLSLRTGHLSLMTGHVTGAVYSQIACAEQVLASQMCWSTLEGLYTPHVYTPLSPIQEGGCWDYYGHANHGLIWAMLVYANEAALIIFVICNIGHMQLMSMF